VEVDVNSGQSTGKVNDVNVSFDISGLAGGIYYCELTITDPCAFNSPEVVEITLYVGPTMCSWPGYLEFNAPPSGGNPASEILSVSNCGANTLNWEITADCNWLLAEPNWGNSTGEVNEVNIGVDVSGLGEGVYQCNLTISDPCAWNSPHVVDVNLIIPGAVIGLSATQLEFTGLEGGANPADKVLGIRNVGAGILNWAIMESCGWLSVSPGTGSSTGEVDDVNVSVDIAGLGKGSYQCNLTISDPCAENSPQIVDVNLVVVGPLIGVSATDFEFITPQGAGNPNDKILGISNTGGGTLNWEINYDCNWLTAEPNSGISTGEVDDVNLSVDKTGLSEGTHTCTLTVSDPNADNSPRTVNVRYVVECMSPNHPDYSEWVDVGRPECWCYPRQCHGDADGLQDGDPKVGLYYVWSGDLALLSAGWKRGYSGNPATDPWICADFDHKEEGDPKTCYVRIWSGDLSIMLTNWKSNPPPDCLD
jgi:hypothetical protein